MKRQLTVTVGTAAYNEEANIEKMLWSILQQETKRTRITKIVVISDGSSDKTVQNARSVKDHRIKVIAHRSRTGQPSRLEEVIKNATTDVVVIMDADSVLGNKYAIENIAKRFHRSKKIGVVAGNTIPVPGKTFIEKAINNYIYARQDLQKEYDFGKKALVAHAYLAFSRKYRKQATIAHGILNFDAYSYFACKKGGFRFSYAHDSIVYYKSAASITEYLSQTKRHISGGRQLYAYFNKEIVDRGFAVPSWVMGRLMLYQLRANPFGYLLLKCLFLVSSYQSKYSAKNLNVTWDFIGTTKAGINV